MSKAQELAEKNCQNCPTNKNCAFVCMPVMLQLWASCNKSPHEMNEMMRNARENLRMKKRRELDE